MNKGIAHISVRGCGMFVPARSPYDRQVLADHVASYARTHGRVQVLLDGARWLVSAGPAGRGRLCARCGGSAALQWTASEPAGATCCARCALGQASPATLARRPAPALGVTEAVTA